MICDDHSPNRLLAYGGVPMEKKRKVSRSSSPRVVPNQKKVKSRDTEHLLECSMLETLEARGCEKTC